MGTGFRIRSCARREYCDASNRRRRPAEEEDHARDRAGPDPAVGQGARRARRLAEGGDRAARSRQGEEAGTAFGRRPVLQAIGGAAACASRNGGYTLVGYDRGARVTGSRSKTRFGRQLIGWIAAYAFVLQAVFAGAVAAQLAGN